MNKHLQILKKNQLRRRKGSKYYDLTSPGVKAALSLAAPAYAIMHLNQQRNIGNYNDRLLGFTDANGRSIIREGGVALALYGVSYLFVDNVLPKLVDSL